MQMVTSTARDNNWLTGLRLITFDILFVCVFCVLTG